MVGEMLALKLEPFFVIQVAEKRVNRRGIRVFPEELMKAFDGGQQFGFGGFQAFETQFRQTFAHKAVGNVAGKRLLAH